MVNKYVVGCSFNYHQETTVTAFSFPIKHEDLKNKKAIFVTDQQPSLNLRQVFTPIVFKVQLLLKSH